jgi:integrase
MGLCGIPRVSHGAKMHQKYTGRHKKPNAMASIKKILLDSGEVRWLARIHRRGQVSRAKRFTIKTEAEAWARGVETKLDQGQQLPVKTSSDLTVKKAVEAYLDSHSSIPSRQKGAYKAVVLDLGALAVKSITRTHVKNWLAALSETRVPPLGPKGKGKSKPYAASTRRKFYYALKAALEWHSGEVGYALSSTLFTDVDVPATWENPRERRISDTEVKDLLDAAADFGQQWPILIQFALETACRLQELVLVEWRHLASTGDSLFIRKEIEKTNRGRSVPLSLPARALLKQLKGDRQSPTGRIFDQMRDPAQTSEEFGRIADAAKCPDVDFHTLRHEATSRLCESQRFQLYELMSITGHTQLSTFQRYMHLLPSSLAKRFEN